MPKGGIRKQIISTRTPLQSRITPGRMGPGVYRPKRVKKKDVLRRTETSRPEIRSGKLIIRKNRKKVKSQKKSPVKTVTSQKKSTPIPKTKNKKLNKFLQTISR